jgi:hypothetical protein
LNEDGQTSTFKSGRAIEHGHLKKWSTNHRSPISVRLSS